MAGYIFTIDNLETLKQIISTGVYSTRLKIENITLWKSHHEGTFADYLSMKEGDNIYFFHKRKIYGVGVLTNIKDQCFYLNFPNADIPLSDSYEEIKEKMILNGSVENLNNRILCTFRAYPNFFEEGIDMDEVLTSNPAAFKMMRAMWKVSFIKIDDIENKAMIDVFLKKNEHLIDMNKCEAMIYPIHNKINSLNLNQYKFTSDKILKMVEDKSKIKHEMAIEAALIDYISRNTTNNIFGHWDYISHQVIASPFKPIDYMDKMDIFGYRYVENFKTISKYLMIELKKDVANKEAVDQAMKYVDWIQQEYSHDYGMIEAYIVAKDFPTNVIKYKNEIAKRIYTIGSRPAYTNTWAKLRLISYRYDTSINELIFEEII